MDPLNRFALLLSRLESVRHMDPANHEHAVVLADLTLNVGGEVSFTGFDSARLQRASEGPR